MSAAKSEHMRPSFFIIGANKCGTSSLYRYLLANPGVLPCAKKEPNFFGQHSADYIAGHIDDYDHCDVSILPINGLRCLVLRLAV